MHVTKFTKAAAGHILMHNEPTEARKSRDNVDSSLTTQNYNLLHAHGKNGMDNLKRVLNNEKIYCSPRKDVNVLCSWIVTAPKDLPQEREREFFVHAAKFFNERYKPSKCVSAWVHTDEKTPHLHFDFVPIVNDTKRGQKVCAKEVISRKDLLSVHKDFTEYIKKEMQLELEILNGETATNGNKTILELKTDTLKKGVKKLKQLKTQVQNEIEREICR